MQACHYIKREHAATVAGMVKNSGSGHQNLQPLAAAAVGQLIQQTAAVRTEELNRICRCSARRYGSSSHSGTEDVLSSGAHFLPEADRSLLETGTGCHMWFPRKLHMEASGTERFHGKDYRPPFPPLPPSTSGKEASLWVLLPVMTCQGQTGQSDGEGKLAPLVPWHNPQVCLVKNLPLLLYYVHHLQHHGKILSEKLGTCSLRTSTKSWRSQDPPPWLWVRLSSVCRGQGQLAMTAAGEQRGLQAQWLPCGSWCVHKGVIPFNF